MNIEYKNGKIELINYLKGFSIITIVLMHNMQWFLCPINSIIDKAILLGGAGVHVFFLVSAIGLTLSYIRKPMSYVDFIKRRFTNVYLPYITIIVIEFLLPFIIQENRLIALSSHVFLFKMFSGKYIESFGVPFWFMSGIICFYLIYILLRKIQIKINNNRLFVLSALIISFLWMLFVFLIGKSEERVFNSFFLQFLWEFVIGMVIAEYFNKNSNLKIRYKELLIAMVLGLGIHGALGLSGFKVFNDFFSLIGYCSLALLVSNIKFVRNIVLWVGSFSFELYLVHYLASNIAKTCITNKVAIFVVSLFLAIIIAIVYNKVIKKLK